MAPAFYLYPGHTIPGRHFQIVLPYAGESPGYGNTIPIRHSKRIKFKSRSNLSVFSQKNNFFSKKIQKSQLIAFQAFHHLTIGIAAPCRKAKETGKALAAGNPRMAALDFSQL